MALVLAAAASGLPDDRAMANTKDKGDFSRSFMQVFFVALASFLLGYQATISQVLLIREVLVVLFGNELCLGVIFCSWFFGVALGAWAASRLVDKSKYPLSVFVLTELSLPVVLTGLLPLVRTTRSWLGTAPGELIPFFKLAAATGSMVIPLSLLVGFTFPFACRSMRLVRPMSDATWSGPQSIGWVYILESSGSLVAGALFTFVLVRHFSSFAVAFISMVTVSAGLLLLVLFMHGRVRRAWLLLLVCAIVLCGGAMTLLLDGHHKLNMATVLARWRSMGQRLDLVASRDSKYQNLALGVQEEQYSLFTNGQYAFSFPDPYSSAQEANLFMCEHPNPREVLLVGGTPGVLCEILRHPVTRVDYLEIDPQVLTIIAPYLSEAESESLCDPRVTIFYEDGRHFIKRSRDHRRYDLVIIKVPDPSTAMLNRFYTQEFFLEIKDVLRPGGVAVTGISSSSTYFGEEIQSFSGSLFATLRDSFAYLAIAPGETNYFFVSDSANAVTDDAEMIAQRYESRAIESKYFSKHMFSNIFWPERVRFTRESFERAENLRMNTDNTPVTYFLNLVLWIRYSGGRFGPALLALSKVHFGWLILIIVCAFALASAVLFARRDGTESAGGPLALVAVGTAGVAGMAFDLIALYAYQNVYGYLYQEIGLVVALFMTGLALGSVLATVRLMRNPANSAVLLLALEILIAGFALALPRLLRASAALPEFGVGKPCFLTVVVAAGFITGAVFPVANAVFMRAGGTMGRSASLTDSTDHMGAALGAFLTGVFLIPIFGAPRTCAALSAMNFLSAVLLASWLVRKKRSLPRQ